MAVILSVPDDEPEKLEPPAAAAVNLMVPPFGKRDPVTSKLVGSSLSGCENSRVKSKVSVLGASPYISSVTVRL